MARTLKEIQTPILQDIADSDKLPTMEILTTEEQTLSSATSTSKVSIWRLFVYIIAKSILIFEQLLDVFKADIEKKVRDNRPHTSEWYLAKTLAFQYGDELVDSDEYAVIDVDKKIIKQASVKEGDREVIIKVATLSGDELVKLPDEDMVNALDAYLFKVFDAGTKRTIVNLNADKLKVDIDFYYDALLVDGTGMHINLGYNVVEKAIKAYLKSLDFDGEFDINKLSDYLQNAVGYKSMKINYVGFKAGLSTNYTMIERIYEPLSGYMNLDEINVNYYAVV